MKNASKIILISALLCLSATMSVSCNSFSGTGHQHELSAVAKVEATCTTAGKIVYKCKKCDNVSEKEIPALGHDHAEAERIE